MKPTKDKPVRWRVENKKTGALIALFVVEQHARNFAVGKSGRVVEIKGKSE